ncbi:signal recognition particle receptor beta subunit domain-containing protein [Phthorimaea operculella]|nr:signal recognition particle receptor beta subunit domain-containing protein [Phthorimaea operculella]
MDADAEVIKERIQTTPVLNNPVYITLLSVVVLIFTILFWWFISRRRSLRKAVVLTGLSDSGKTLLFVRICYNQFRQTFTSMKENVADYIIGSRTLKIVDLPGQERLRNKFFDQYKGQAKGLIYVVDSVTIQKEIRDVAEYLYTVLADPAISGSGLPVLVLCNKQDQPLAKGSQVIRTLLEKELNLVRLTKSSQLQSVDPSQSNEAAYLGKRGKDFEFSHLSCKVEFAESSANTGDDDQPTDTKAVEEWISNL